jgi:hypothetical protein
MKRKGRSFPARDLRAANGSGGGVSGSTDVVVRWRKSDAGLPSLSAAILLAAAATLLNRDTIPSTTSSKDLLSVMALEPG